MGATRIADLAPVPAGPEDAEQLRRELDALRHKHAALQRKLDKVVVISDLYEEQLRCARRDLKQLRDLFLPICMYCKRVRTDDAYWEKIEAYFSRHAAVSFSHGICPSCMEEHFGPAPHGEHRVAAPERPAPSGPAPQPAGRGPEPAIEELERLLEDPHLSAAPSAAILRRAVTRCKRVMARYRKVVEISDGYQEEYQQRIERAVRQDPLTGLASRAAAVQAMEEACDGRCDPGAAALMIVDVAGLRALNETHGYGTGDRLLIALSRALRVSAPRALLRARWSGARFAVLLATDDAPQALETVQRALGAVAVEEGHLGGTAEIRAGLALRQPGMSAAAWVAAAERAARQ